jgi:hypothetical protein
MLLARTAPRIGSFSILLFALNAASAEPHASSATMHEAASIKQTVACPSQDFVTFFHVFSENIAVQRAFTQLPLVNGLRDLQMSPAVTKRRISEFKKVSRFKDGYVFPNGEMRREEDYLFVMRSGTSEYFDVDKAQSANIGKGKDGVSILLYVANTDEAAYYRFKRSKNCWVLYELDEDLE